MTLEQKREQAIQIIRLERDLKPWHYIYQVPLGKKFEQKGEIYLQRKAIK
jgi:hypothetical protein